MAFFKSLADALSHLKPQVGYGQSPLSSPSQLLAHTLNTINNDVFKAPYNAFEKLAINTSGANVLKNPYVGTPVDPNYQPLRTPISNPYQFQTPAQYYDPSRGPLYGNQGYFYGSPNVPSYLLPQFNERQYIVGQSY